MACQCALETAMCCVSINNDKRIVWLTARKERLKISRIFENICAKKVETGYNYRK